MHDLARLDLEQEEVGVARELAEALDDEPASVGREGADGEKAAEVERPLLSVVEPPHDDLEVAAVAAVRRVREQRAVAGGDRRPVVEARIDDERLGLGPALEKVELRPLVAALVHEEQDATVGQERSVHRLRQVGELLELPTLRRHEKELPRSRQVGGEQQRRAVARERERPRLRQLEQLSERPRQ